MECPLCKNGDKDFMVEVTTLADKERIYVCTLKHCFHQFTESGVLYGSNENNKNDKAQSRERAESRIFGWIKGIIENIGSTD